jgi:glutathione S-transferase
VAFEHFNFLFQGQRKASGRKLFAQRARSRYQENPHTMESRHMANRYTLYGTWLSGPTYKVALLLSLLEKKFDYVHVDLRTGKNKEPDYLAKNRFGQVPCLVDAENQFALCQSGLILDYLAAEEKRFLPSDRAGMLRAREWIFWDFDRLVPNIYRPRARKLGFRPADPATLQMYVTDAQAALAVLDNELGKTLWLVGKDASIADIDIYGVVRYAPEGDFDLSMYRNVSAWIARMESLSGFRSPEKLLPQKSVQDV